MNIDSMYPSKYFKAADLQEGPIELLISSVEARDVGGDGKPEDTKPVISFNGQAQSFVLNVTNKETIKAAYGPETTNWTGKRISLYATTTPFSGRMVDCVRVSIPAKTSTDSLLDA